MIGTDKFWRVINFWKIVIFRKIWFCLTSFRIALNITVVNYVIHLLKFTADSPPMTQQNWFSPVSKPFLDYSTFCFWSKERTDLFGHVRYFTVFATSRTWPFEILFLLLFLSDYQIFVRHLFLLKRSCSDRRGFCFLILSFIVLTNRTSFHLTNTITEHSISRSEHIQGHVRWKLLEVNLNLKAWN